MTGADIAQNSLGFNGTGIKVAVMDTGLDYDHADLGGDGVTRSNSSVFPTARVTHGFDLVGDSYNASFSSPAYQPVPAAGCVSGRLQRTRHARLRHCRRKR